MLARSSRILFCRKVVVKPEWRCLAVAATAKSANSQTPQMFCYQCEQTQGGRGCATKGMCGKDSKTSNLQDLLVYNTAGVAQLADLCSGKSMTIPPAVNQFILTATFATLTNVNFDDKRIFTYVQEAQDHKAALSDMFVKKGGSLADIKAGPAKFSVPSDIIAAEMLGRQYGIKGRKSLAKNDDFHGLQETALYGIKGAVAYFDHAERIRALNPASYPKEESDRLFKTIYGLYDRFVDPPNTLGEHVQLALDVGGLNVGVMAVLDAAHKATFGAMVPTTVSTVPVAGHCILVSGHDMVDLLYVLEQTAGKGINVYTHGEMLPAHSYPRLAAFPHLIGHYGRAWMQQKSDFADFPGAILMTSNCILDPAESYADRIFTVNATGVRNAAHITGVDYNAVVAAAKKCTGFVSQDGVFQSASQATTFETGYGQSFTQTDLASSELAQAVVEGKLRNVFVVGGCDGREGERSYFTNFGEDLPADAIVLTLGCGKFRLNHLPVARERLAGTQLPRVMDVGQCNDAFAAVRIATSLASALGTTIDKLPLHFALSWFEQKAVAVLLSLLHLGVKGIRLGPNLPAFLTPNLLQALGDGFGLAPVAEHASDDIKAMTGKGAV